MRPEVKFRVIYRHKDKYSISEMCRFFDVSRSGYYGFVDRMGKPAKDLELSELIRECQAETKQTYGYRRVAIWLERVLRYGWNAEAFITIPRPYCVL